MVVGTITISLYIRDNRSLKEKRKIVKSVIAKVHHRFNASIAEIDSNDKWQMIGLGVSVVGNDRRFVNSALDKVLTYIDSLYLGEMITSDIEIVNL
ncbi:MAG: DUF503 domain-containing protein [Thermodesulfobacteriota bacterium]